MDKLISVYWFVILGIVATVVVIMTSSFYGGSSDVRGIEARILANKIADCVSREGKINSAIYDGDGFVSGFSDEILAVCEINLETEEDWKDPQIYFRIDFFYAESQNEGVFSVEQGNLNFVPACSLQGDEEIDRLAKCEQKRIYSTSNGKQFLVKVLAAVGKSSKNVK